jgi:hypothetical protein
MNHTHRSSNAGLIVAVLVPLSVIIKAICAVILALLAH